MHHVDQIKLLVFLILARLQQLLPLMSLSSFLSPSADLHKRVEDNLRRGHFDFAKALLHLVQHHLHRLWIISF